MLTSTPTVRPSDPTRGATAAALTAAGLTGAFAALQVFLAAGAPFGGHVWGGRSDTAVLSPGLRVGSGIAAVILGWMAAVILARADLISTNPVPRRWLARTTWTIAAYMALNTMANLASASSVERYGFGPSTAAIAAATAVVARRGSRS